MSATDRRLVAFGLHRHPPMHLRRPRVHLCSKKTVFSNRALSASNAVMFFVGCPRFAAFFLFTVYVQQVPGYSPLEAGMSFLPMALGIVAGSALATRLTERRGPKPPLVAGLALTSLGPALAGRPRQQLQPEPQPVELAV
jgi:Na+/melibiose symporter-like transporter